MGNIHTTVGEVRDLITEEVGCKAGLLVTDYEARAVLNRCECDDSELFSGHRHRDAHVRIRPEDVESVIVELRYGLGDLPDRRPGFAAPIDFLKALSEAEIDAGPLIKAFKEVVDSGRYQILGEEAIEEMRRLSKMPLPIVQMFFVAIGTQFDRSVSWFRARVSNVAWAIPLRELFETETIPDDPDAYLDQRYIDYLVHNSEDMQRMHWRNFERLTAEFFRRRGYEIELGPGTRDGGIDVRIWPAGSAKIRPPLLLIQCKRYKPGNDVQLETVKAFWSDIVYEGAHRGLIATTSRVSPEGVKLSRARKWPLGFAQSKQVHQWARTMWRHSPLRRTGR